MQSVKVRQSERRRIGAYPVLILVAFLFLIPTGVVPGVDLFNSRSYAQNPVPRTLPNTDLNPYGANFFLHLEAESWKIDKTLQMANEAGLGWVKQQFPWESLEKSSGRFWDDRYNVSTWEKFDHIVNAAAENGLQVIARLDRPPDWAREPETTPLSPPKDFAAYGRFVGEVAKHYKGRIHYYQIWNEPNLTEEWGGKPVDPKAYVELLKVAYQEIKKADPNAYVLSAPLAQTVERNQAHLSDVAFLEEMYRNGAQSYFDILFANAYGFNLPPEDPPDPNVLNFSRVLLLRNVMERNGDAGKPVWFNEFGWNSSPADMADDRLLWGRVSEQEQAEYTTRAIQIARRDWPWAGVFNVWFFRQAGQYQWDDSQFYFRMVDTGFTPRLVYKSLRVASAPLKSAGPGRYQETNPALVVGSGWDYVHDEDAAAQGYLGSERTGDKLAITFYGGSLSLLAYTGPECGRLYLSLDGNGVDGLPRDSSGHSFLDLYSDESSSQIELPVVGGLRAGTHKLELTVAAERNPKSVGRKVAVDGFVVGEEGLFPWPEMTFGGIVFVILMGIVVWRRRHNSGVENGSGNGRA